MKDKILKLVIKPTHLASSLIDFKILCGYGCEVVLPKGFVTQLVYALNEHQSLLEGLEGLDPCPECGKKPHTEICRLVRILDIYYRR